MSNQISNNKIRQVVLLGFILTFLYLIGSNLREFLPAFLSAVTLFVVFRDCYCKLVEVKKWRPWVASVFLMLVSVLVILLPLYYVIDILVSKLANSRVYVNLIINYAETLHQYIEQKLGFNILNSIDLKRVGEWATSYSSSLVSKTIDTITTIVMTYFILYFMLVNTRKIENAFRIMVPLKRSNLNRIGDKFRKMVIANVIGIPVIALGQGLTVLIGFLIFGVPNPFFLFILTIILSVIPIVGGSIIYIPVALVFLAEENIVGALGILAFGFLSTMMDNIMRFTFLKKIENIHPLNSVFGIIVGLKLFGFIGLVFGPILISITALLIKIYRDEFSEKQEESFFEEKSDCEDTDNI